MIYGFGRLAVILWLCAFGGQAFVLFAFYNALAEAHDEEVAARLSAIASRVAVTANERATIGFPLAFQQDLQQVIETIVRDGSVAVYVCDPQRHVLFATDSEVIGTLAPASWFAGAAPTGARSWQAFDDDGVEVGMPVNDAFGHRSGEVLARAPKQSARLELFVALQQTAAVSLLFLAGMLAVCLLGIRVVVRPFYYSVLDLKRRYDRLNAVMKSGVTRGSVRLDELDAGEPPSSPAIAVARVIRGLKEIESDAAAIDDAPASEAPVAAAET